MDFTKYAYEEVFRYYEFKRIDGKDGLATGEIIVSHAVTCREKSTGTDVTSTMISNASIVDDTQVTYKLKSGEAGKTYQIIIKAVTSAGQKLEGVVEIYVK